LDIEIQRFLIIIALVSSIAFLFAFLVSEEMKFFVFMVFELCCAILLKIDLLRDELK
jgi:hypothetical protein